MQIYNTISNFFYPPLEIPAPIQIPGFKIVHTYPGDLDSSMVTAEFVDADTLKISFPGLSSDINFTARRQDIFASNPNNDLDIAIINAANRHLGGGGGIDGAIHSKGGASYGAGHAKLKEQYRSQYVEGHAAMIGSGELRRKYHINNVIVVAGPQGKPTEEAQGQGQLYSCLFNSLVLAHSQGKTAVASPAISTGIFGFPNDVAAQVFKRAVFDFYHQHPDTTVRTVSIHYLPTDPDSSLQAYKSSNISLENIEPIYTTDV